MTTTTTTPKTYPKDSFDRFGDDLTGLLLAELPTLADRFRWECVCRQWYRLVFTSQRELIIDQKSVNNWCPNSPKFCHNWCRSLSTFSYNWTHSLSADCGNCCRCLTPTPIIASGHSRHQNNNGYGFTWLKVLMAKCSQIRSLRLILNGIDQKTVDQLMDVLFNNGNGNQSAAAAADYDHLYRVHCPLPLPHQQLLNTNTPNNNKRLGFRRLTNLTISCPYNLANVSVNSCVDCLPKVAINYPDLLSLSLTVYCFSASHIKNIIQNVQCFGRRLERLHLALYIFSGRWKVSVRSLVNCPRLEYLSLECSHNMDFIDVDIINRQLKRSAIVTKVYPLL